MSDLIKKALVYQHFEPKSVVDRLRDREVAAAKDLVATEEERSYRPYIEASALLEQLQARFKAELIQHQNDLNFAMLTGQTLPDSSANQARISQGKL